MSSGCDSRACTLIPWRISDRMRSTSARYECQGCRWGPEVADWTGGMQRHVAVCVCVAASLTRTKRGACCALEVIARAEPRDASRSLTAELAVGRRRVAPAGTLSHMSAHSDGSFPPDLIRASRDAAELIRCYMAGDAGGAASVMEGWDPSLTADQLARFLAKVLTSPGPWPLRLGSTRTGCAHDHRILPMFDH
jgi:hypothetical protein